MRSSRRFLAVLLFVLVSACESAFDDEGPVEIRVRNASTIDFASVVIGFPDQSESYGAVPARSATEYRAIDRAYRYAAVQVALADTSLALIPIDYVGEVELDGGEYTYELNVTEGERSLTFRLVRD